MVAPSLIHQLLSLPVEDREEIVVRLSDSLPALSRIELDTLMAAEAEDRIAAFERGEIKAHAGTTVLAELRSRRR
jgi:putative addiction module component (TIGR02574 family)